jgi:membrane dipeptidase
MSRGGSRIDLSGALPGYHVDTAKLQAGGVDVQVFACAVGADDPVQAMRTAGLLIEEIHRHPDDLVQIRTHRDIQRARDAGQVGCMLALEGAVPLGGQRGVFRAFCEVGVRLITLAHREQPTPWSAQADASYFGLCDDAFREAERRNKRGLTDWGRELVPLMDEAGVVIDLAHCNDATFWEVTELAENPVVVSHGCAFSLCPHSRNLTDEQIVALAQKGGVLGLAFYHRFVAEDGGDLDRLLDHLEHVLNIAGPNCVGLGSDFDGLPTGTTPLVPDASQLPLLVEGMLRRGLGESVIRKVLGENFQRLFARVFSVPMQS